MIIKAKSNGLSLEAHTQAVLSTALAIDELGGFKLNKDVIKWACILHDVGKANPLFQQNMETSNFENVCRHEISSILFINAVPKKIRDIVGFMILSHHKSIYGAARSFYDLMDCREDICFKNHIGDVEEWGKAVKDFLYYHYNKNIKVPTNKEAVEILNHFYDKTEYLEQGWSEYRAILLMADHLASCYENDAERNEILRKLYKTPNISFYESENEKYPLSLIKSDKTKKHTILVSSTGSGKTNFCMKRCTKRIFYVLPFQASIDAMFKRISRDINSDNSYSIGIKHASTASRDFIDDESKILSNFFGQSVKILTPYQIMQPSFGLKGYEITIMDVLGQDVILDEIHTYSGINLTAILDLIRVLKIFNCNIHICTATMPTFLKNRIIEILGKHNIQFVSLTSEQQDSFNRHIIHVKDYNVNDVIESYNAGKKVLVIRNTKQKAKDEYINLKKIIPESNIMLLHSEFKRKDRAHLEDRLYDLNKSKGPCVVVSTQVVEVSLDINFDTMFTENADIMSLVQRFGRVGRDRTGILRHIYISPCIMTTMPYDAEDCERTYDALSKYNNNVLPERDIQEIIDYVHQTVNIAQFDSSPLDKNGKWKYKLYSNVISSSISDVLNFVGDVAIMQSDLNEYIQTKNPDLEIPIGDVRRRRNNNGFTPYYGNQQAEQDDDARAWFYVISDSMYDEKIGIV